jgi:CRP-like cAMP-binding protein
MPVFAHLTLEERKELLTDMQYVEAPEGTPVVRQGEVNESAFFIIEGGAIAGRKENDQDRVLEVLNAGDFFGEIAALTGVPRTANVVTNKAAVLLRVPASTLRLMMKHTEVNQVLMSKLRERMTRVDMVELPKMLAYDQHVLRDLRTPEQPVLAAAT